MSISAKALLFDISRALDAGTLFLYLADAEADVTITSDERDEIKTAITKRFGDLNAASARHDRRTNIFPQGRWTVERGTARLNVPDAEIHSPS
jgi:hypothetical protein